MGHIFSEVVPFLLSVFAHWQIWLSGSGIGGFIVIAINLIERFANKTLSKRASAYIFIVSFFLCACFLSWVERSDALSVCIAEKQRIQDEANTMEADLRSKIGATDRDCAYKQGLNDALQGQNRSQQATINGCLSQAIKLIAPEPLTLTARVAPLGGFKTANGSPLTSAAILITTNRLIAPFFGDVHCSDSFHLLGAGSTWSGHIEEWEEGKRPDDRTFQLRRISPGLNPGDTYVLVITYTYVEGSPLTCTFKQSH